ncbi:hypothetical protein C5167_044149 [Papaver somniferum]|uniref:Uncharacterized protein n=1 Tax=Papaver somniferum TaxID=3469 RepID=A0A4Y7LBM4_PAPSO|nr:hypothetical protein C5167_044149 [Papaver somniferum]
MSRFMGIYCLMGMKLWSLISNGLDNKLDFSIKNLPCPLQASWEIILYVKDDATSKILTMLRSFLKCFHSSTTFQIDTEHRWEREGYSYLEDRSKGSQYLERYSEPPQSILLPYEVTTISSLDAEPEKSVQEALYRVMVGIDHSSGHSLTFHHTQCRHKYCCQQEKIVVTEEP